MGEELNAANEAWAEWLEAHPRPRVNLMYEAFLSGWQAHAAFAAAAVREGER